MQDEGETVSFLSTNYLNRSYLRQALLNANDEYPNLTANFFLTTDKIVQMRQAYTFMALLGDFGGFNDALILILGTLMAVYSSKMYQSAIASELPYSPRRQLTTAQSTAFE